MKNALQRLTDRFARGGQNPRFGFEEGSSELKIQNQKSKIKNSIASFTLIEVLVSMAIITMIVLMVSNMFLNSSEAWDIGARKAELTTSGRAAIEFIARELSQAVAGPVESLHTGLPNLIFRQENENEIRFVALSQEPGGNNRALRDVIFYFKDAPDFKIMACRNRAAIDCYNDKPSDWSRNSANTLLDNILDLQFFVYETMADLDAGNPAGVPHDFSKLPVCVDVFIEILSRDDMKTADTLSGANKISFMNKNAKAYSTRVYFPNRPGYSQR